MPGHSRERHGEGDPAPRPRGGCRTRRRPHMRSTASIVAIVVGILMVVAGAATWVVVSSTLADQKIVVSDDASCLAGDEVDGPFSAYCQADVIDKHTMK